MISSCVIPLYCFNRIYDCRKFFVRLYQYISPNDYQRNGKIRYKLFKDKYDKRKRKSCP